MFTQALLQDKTQNYTFTPITQYTPNTQHTKGNQNIWYWMVGWIGQWISEWIDEWIVNRI